MDYQKKLSTLLGNFTNFADEIRGITVGVDDQLLDIPDDSSVLETVRGRFMKSPEGQELHKYGVAHGKTSAGFYQRAMSAYYRFAVGAMLGAFPLHGQMHVLHLDEAMCELLVENTGVYDQVSGACFASVWDVKRLHSGDDTAKFHTDMLDVVVANASEQKTGVSFTVSEFRAFSLRQRTAVILRANADYMHEPDGAVEIALGGLRLRAPVGYGYFGISVPSQYLDRVILHARNLSAVYGYLQTGAIDKTVGELTDHRSVDSTLPVARFSHVLAHDIDSARVPDGVPLYALRWSGDRESILVNKQVQYFNTAHLTVMLARPADFGLLVPSRRVGTDSYFAAVTSEGVVEDYDAKVVYDCMCTTRAGDYAAMAALDATVVTLGQASGFLKPSVVASLPHTVGAYQVCTYERDGLPTVYNCRVAGRFSFAGLAGANREFVLREHYGVTGKSRL